MSDELERFLDSVRKTPHLVEELRSLLETPAEVIRWASDRGFQLTSRDIDELREYAAELSDDDLDQVAGGEDEWAPGTGGTTGGTGGG